MKIIIQEEIKNKYTETLEQCEVSLSSTEVDTMIKSIGIMG
jgi:fibronectin type 3 domain-containing protein